MPGAEPKAVALAEGGTLVDADNRRCQKLTFAGIVLPMGPSRFLKIRAKRPSINARTNESSTGGLLSNSLLFVSLSSRWELDGRGAHEGMEINS